MPKGPLKKETKLERLKAQLREALDLDEDATSEIFDLPAPTENKDDLAREAQAAINYFYSGGNGFKDKECKNCGETFAYAWNVDFISMCSLHCLRESLEKIGIKWDHTKPPSERWGFVARGYIPATVSPEALQTLKSTMNEVREVQLPSISDA